MHPNLCPTTPVTLRSLPALAFRAGIRQRSWSPDMPHNTRTQRIILVDDSDHDNFFHDMAAAPIDLS